MVCREENRVVVTGLGVVSPLGVGLNSFWEGLLAGRSGISRITHFDAADFSCQIAGEVPGFDPEEWMDRKTARRMDRVSHFGMASSAMAIADAKLDVKSLDPRRLGVSIGSGIGGSATIEEGHRALLEKGPRAISPFFVSKILVNMTACMVSITHGLKGPLSACSVACSTGANAVGDAFRILQRGDADVMIAGSTEASVMPLPFAGFCATRSMSTRNDSPETASRPFEKNRDGFVMGEGAGIVVLERLDHAEARGARAYAEIAGYGSTADAFHFTAPHPEGDGMARVMQAAIDDSGLAPEDIGHINAHGTSTVLNDKTESMAIAKVFGEHAGRLKVSSNKSMIGHLMAAAGAVEFVAAVMAVHTGQVPPTINYEEPDPDCQLDYVTNGAEAVELKAVLSNSFGFGGGNASLIVKNHLYQARP